MSVQNDMNESLCDWGSLEQRDLRDIHEDDRFEFAFGRMADDLAESIRRFGLLQPIVVWRPEGIIVDGHHRAAAAKQAGLKTAPVVRLRDSTSERQAFDLALDSFLTDHIPNPVEMSRIVGKAARLMPREEIIESILPRLGIQPALIMYRRYKDIARLPETAQRGLADGTLDASSVPLIELIEPGDREAAIDLILRLHPSKSLQKELLENMYDICKRDDISMKDLLKDFEMDAAAEVSDANTPEQRDAFRHWLHRRRYPTLSRREREFGDISHRLAPGGDIRIHPPPFFEGRRFEVRFAFDSLEAWRERFSALKDMNERIGMLEGFLK